MVAETDFRTMVLKGSRPWFGEGREPCRYKRSCLLWWKFPDVFDLVGAFLSWYVLFGAASLVDFPIFFRFVPICVPCFLEHPCFAPICTDFFWFDKQCLQSKSEQTGKSLSADPFFKSQPLRILVDPLRTPAPGPASDLILSPAIRNANRPDSCEFIRANRFAGKPNFHTVWAIRANRLKPAIRNFFSPRTAIRKRAVQFGDPETIRKNQPIRANLPIDARESGHLP